MCLVSQVLNRFVHWQVYSGSDFSSLASTAAKTALPIWANIQHRSPSQSQLYTLHMRALGAPLLDPRKSNLLFKFLRKCCFLCSPSLARSGYPSPCLLFLWPFGNRLSLFIYTEESAKPEFESWLFQILRYDLGSH